MKILFLIALLMYTNNFQAEELKIFNDTLVFNTPDRTTWNLTSKNYDEDREVGFILYTRNPIIDSEGRSVSPVMAIIYEKLNSDSIDVIIYSTNVRMRPGVGFEIDSITTAEEIGMKYLNAVYYDGYYIKDEIRHDILVVHMIKGNIGLQIICDSTESVYEKVVVDMNVFIKSIDFK